MTEVMTNFSKANATLPDAFVSTLKRVRDTDAVKFEALVIALREMQWPYRAIGEPFNVTRVAAKAWYDRALQHQESVELSKTLTVPSLPVKARGSGLKPKKIVPDLTDVESDNVRVLAEKARNVRRWTPQDAPERDAARQLEEALYNYVNRRGVPMTVLARHAGVTRRAIAQRVDKHSKLVSAH